MARTSAESAVSPSAAVGTSGQMSKGPQRRGQEKRRSIVQASAVPRSSRRSGGPIAADGSTGTNQVPSGSFT